MTKDNIRNLLKALFPSGAYTIVDFRNQHGNGWNVIFHDEMSYLSARVLEIRYNKFVRPNGFMMQKHGVLEFYLGEDVVKHVTEYLRRA